MKRSAVYLLVLLLVVSLCACEKSDAVYQIEKNGILFEVDTAKGTVFDGTHTYGYTFSGTSSAYDINISYPDGSTYYWSQSGQTGHGGWSDDYDEERYVDGSTLCDVITEKAPEPSNPAEVLAIILLSGIGAFNAAAPHTAWYWEYGWRCKDAKPSDAALIANRVGGIVAIAAAILMIVF